VTLLDAGGKPIRSLSPNEREPDPQRLGDPDSGRAGVTGWRDAASCFDAPAGVTAANVTLHFAQYSNNGPGITPKSELWVGDITITPVGTPQRGKKEMMVTLAMPLETEAPRPEISSTRAKDQVEADVIHPDGTKDHITINENGTVEVKRTGSEKRSAFGWKMKKLDLGSFTASESCNAAFIEHNGIMSGDVVADRPIELTMSGKRQSLEPGAYLFNGSFKANENAQSLKTNSVASQTALKAGLAPVAGVILAERDKYTKQGRRNIALDAKVSTTNMRDERFGPQHLIDNNTSEIPIDGVLDYTLGQIQTTGNGGYGGGSTSYTENMSNWPLFVRPSYWLLPYRQPGAVTLKLKTPSKVRLVRLLNTTNAGLNDYATIDYTIDLLNADGSIAWSKDGSFGKPQDRAFKSAFIKPEFFKAYGETFKGMLEPGIKVPFGAGWQDVGINHTSEVSSVRVTVKTFWGLGGGLNEVQIYQ
jgi:hypothetical protein